MSRTSWAALLARAVGGVALVVGVLAPPAYASTIQGTYTATLAGVSGTTVQGSFTFNTATDVFSGTLDFSGGSAFNGVNASFSRAGACLGPACAVALDATVSGDSIVYAIGLSTSSDGYTAGGTISGTKVGAAWAYSGTAGASVPEGGSIALYLLLDISAFLALAWLRHSRCGSKLPNVTSEGTAARA
jgi:hypothetical protein